MKPRLSNLAEYAECFRRVDTREHRTSYAQGQLSDPAEKGAEPVALAAGIPPRTRHEFPARYRWEEDAVRRRLHALIVRDHARPHRIGLIDETSGTKKGGKTPGGQRQHCGSVGKPGSCIVTVHLFLPES